MIKNIFFTDLLPDSTYMITLQIKHNFIVFLDLYKIVNDKTKQQIFNNENANAG